MSLGKRIRALRIEKGYSILKVREITGLSKSTISEIENDKSNPTTETLQKLANALGVQVEQFFKATDEDLEKWDHEYDSNKLAEEVEAKEHNDDKYKDVKEAMDLILSQPGLMLNGELLSDESKIALANAIKMGLAYAEQMQKKEKK